MKKLRSFRCKRTNRILVIIFCITSFLLSRRRVQQSTTPRFYKHAIWRNEDDLTSQPLRSYLGNRVLFSALPQETTDGLGHRFAIVNYELLLALHLRVGYVHRVAQYGSLSPPDDALAVERTFGWDSWQDKRDDLMRQACAQINLYRAEGCDKVRKNFPVCHRLKRGGPFKYLVHVPRELVECYWVSKNMTKCADALEKFAVKNSKPDTVFQMEPWMCEGDYREGNFSLTGKWFRERYWGSDLASRLKRSLVLRREGLGLEENRIQVAVHVRRGDFFHYPNRTMVSDAAYSDVIGQIKRAVDVEYDTDVPMSVSVFSEGVPRDEARIKDNHNISEMDPIYVTEKGEHIMEPTEHWAGLVRKRVNEKDVRTGAYVASNTLQAIHTMICADVFVGSRSGLSAQLVSTLARGLIVMPASTGGQASANGFNLKFSHNGTGARIQQRAVRVALRQLLQGESVQEWKE